MMPHANVKEILELREQGYSYQEISKRTNISYPTVASYCSRYRPHLRNIAYKNKYKEHLETITFLRRKGRNLAYIADQTGLSTKTIAHVCNKYCSGLRNISKRKITQKQEIEIIQYYRYRYPIKQISNMVKVSDTTIRRILKKQGFNPELMYKDRSL